MLHASFFPRTYDVKNKYISNTLLVYLTTFHPNTILTSFNIHSVINMSIYRDISDSRSNQNIDFRIPQVIFYIRVIVNPDPKAMHNLAIHLIVESSNFNTIIDLAIVE